MTTGEQRSQERKPASHGRAPTGRSCLRTLGQRLSLHWSQSVRVPGPLPCVSSASQPWQVSTAPPFTGLFPGRLCGHLASFCVGVPMSGFPTLLTCHWLISTDRQTDAPQTAGQGPAATCYPRKRCSCSCSLLGPWVTRCQTGCRPCPLGGVSFSQQAPISTMWQCMPEGGGVGRRCG